MVNIAYTIGGYSMEQERSKKDILARLKRIEGQIRGLQRMVEEGAACQDILMQSAAATAAIKKVGAIIIQAHLEECMEKNRREPDKKQEDSLKDFQAAISRYIDWA
jgi:DNA-binding FrmR family transcriptional regulator